MGIRFVLVAAFVAAVVVVFGFFEPAGASWFPSCVFHRVTGLHCPGCGGTRALQSLFDGRVVHAVRCNPLLTLGAVILPPLLLWQRRLESRQIFTPRLTWGVAVAVLVYFVARNVPSPTTSPLAPPPLEQAAGDR